MRINLARLESAGIEVRFEQELNGDITDIQITLPQDDDSTMVADLVKKVTHRWPLTDGEQDSLHGNLYSAIEKAVITHLL